MRWSNGLLKGFVKNRLPNTKSFVEIDFQKLPPVIKPPAASCQISSTKVRFVSSPRLTKQFKGFHINNSR